MSDINPTPVSASGADISSRYYAVEHHPENGTLLGFWIYLMSDCLIFACLFATYGVLGRSYAGGPSGADLFELPLVANKLAHSKKFGAVCCLGAVIQGETAHHEYINQPMAAGIMRANGRYGLLVVDPHGEYRAALGSHPWAGERLRTYAARRLPNTSKSQAN